jgi:Spy/CpxP family protein refolding chaperone
MASKIIFACGLVSALSFLAALGSAEDAPPLHQGSWPIHQGHQRQPTQDELNAQHRQDVTPDQANDIDRLYDQLLSNSEKILKQHPALVR